MVIGTFTVIVDIGFKVRLLVESTPLAAANKLQEDKLKAVQIVTIMGTLDMFAEVRHKEFAAIALKMSNLD